MPDVESLVIVPIAHALIQQPLGQVSPPGTDRHGSLSLSRTGGIGIGQPDLQQAELQRQWPDLIVQFLPLNVVGHSGLFDTIGADNGIEIVGFLLFLGTGKRVPRAREYAVPRIVILGVNRVVLVVMTPGTSER